jgi:putative nucleotidyltransferase with HDIG domain
MKALPRGAQFFIIVVFGLGAVAAFSTLPALASNPPLIVPTILLSVIIAVLDLLPVPFRKNQAEFLLSTAIKLAGVIVMPAPVVLLAVFCGTILSESWLRKAWFRLIFNVGSLTITVLIDILLYSLLHQPGYGIIDSFQNVGAVLVLGISDITINSLAMSLILALTARMPVRSVWDDTFKPVLWHEMTMLPIGVFIAMLWKVTPWSVVLSIPPLLLARHAYKMVTDLEWQTREALQALARVLDERDEQTSAHSELVSKYSKMIANEMGLALSEIDVIARAAWLHDIGKVGMRNEILYKPGSLSAEEREQAKRHAIIGGEFLTKFPLFEKGADLVRHHHEWWNGGGYPDALEGEAIPLGARILAVADAYQAMTDERPYRKPLGERIALDELRRGAGTQFDPKVVDAFFRAMGVPFSRREAESEPVAFGKSELPREQRLDMANSG